MKNFHVHVCMFIFSFLLFSSLWFLCFKLVCGRVIPIKV
ncbi:putative membrane protein [Helicobacter pylori CPY1962]|nr:putative membrane protein [Helicobacter pylori CPY1962]